MKIYGHQKTRQDLQSRIVDKQLPQANLFYGTVGIGKKRVSLEVAATLFCQKKDDQQNSLFAESAMSIPCWQCENCQSVISGHHPDLFVIGPTPPVSQKKTSETEQTLRSNWTLKVDQLDALKQKLKFHPLQADYQVIILDGVESMTIATANSLLKTLEEPRANQVFILISSQLNAVLPTIRSRVAKFYFQNLSQKDVQQILKEHSEADVSETWLNFLTECFSGSIPFIQTVLHSDLSLDFLAQLQARSDFTEVSRLVKKTLSHDVDLALLLQCLRFSFLRSSDKDINFFADLTAAEQQLSRHLPKEFILENLLLKF